jgi:hypothetical protein
MGLKQIFDATIAGQSVVDKDREFFSKRVLPVVTGLAAHINKDPDLEVSFKVGGDNGGYFSRRDSSSWWAFEVQFRNKADGTDAGKAFLKLHSNVPEIADLHGTDPHLPGTPVTMNGSACAYETVAENLVVQAARSILAAESGRQLSASIDDSNRVLKP